MIEGLFPIVGERYGEQFTVVTDGLRCDTCGFITIDNKQSAKFTQLVSDAYRKAHDLLTGAEIRTYREHFKMNQLQFSEYLGVGSASVKRWEAGQVQDKAMDELIRIKADPDAALRNLKALRLQVPERYVISNAVMGGRNIELSFALKQHYDKPTQIKMDPISLDRPGLLSILDAGEGLAA
jgi:putative zinc finger/helix-turn-helix YgiT family protein